MSEERRLRDLLTTAFDPYLQEVRIEIPQDARRYVPLEDTPTSSLYSYFPEDTVEIPRTARRYGDTRLRSSVVYYEPQEEKFEVLPAARSYEGLTATLYNEHAERSPHASLTPPSGGRQIVVLAGLLISTTMMALDGTIIVTTIPRITNDFHSIQDIGWYGSVYYLAILMSQPVVGKLFYQFNERSVYMGALLLFEIGSTVCATSQYSYVLIIGRALAGAGGAGLFSGAMLLANYIANDARKTIYIGLISGIYGIAGAMGPLLGGAFTNSYVTWRFAFWLNLPLGALVGLSLLLYQSIPKAPGTAVSGLLTTIQRLDPYGSLLLAATLVLLLFSLQLGGLVYLWSDQRVVGYLVGCAVGLVLFILQQRFFQAPNQRELSIFRLLSDRTVASTVTATMFFSAAGQVQVYFLPIYLQVVKGKTASESGVDMMPYLGVLAVAAILSGAASAAAKTLKPFVWIGMVIFLIGSGLLYTLSIWSTLEFLYGVEAVIGFGAGICIHSTIIVVQTAVAPPDIPLVSALIGFMVALGPTLFIAVAQNVFLGKLRDALASNGLDVSLAGNGGAILESSNFQAGGSQQLVESYGTALSYLFLVALILSSLASVISFGSISRLRR